MVCILPCPLLTFCPFVRTDLVILLDPLSRKSTFAPLYLTLAQPLLFPRCPRAQMLVFYFILHRTEAPDLQKEPVRLVTFTHGFSSFVGVVASRFRPPYQKTSRPDGHFSLIVPLLSSSVRPLRRVSPLAFCLSRFNLLSEIDSKT